MLKTFETSLFVRGSYSNATNFLLQDAIFEVDTVDVRHTDL